MSTPSTTATDLVAALGQRLADLGLAQYSPGGTYTEDPARPAFAWNELPAQPDTAVSASIYNDARDRDEHNPDVYVRLRWRAAGEDPTAVDDHADAAFHALNMPEHQASPQTWPGGVRVLDVRRVGRAQPVADANGRWTRADSYRITLNPPGGIS